MVRTRFAPSPTGYLHIGGLRTALYAYLFAKKNGGRFILRIEDTDQERLVGDATDKILVALKAAGLFYDEGPDVGGEYGPYIQSERKEIYAIYAKQLIERGGAYYCFCDKARLEQLHKDGADKYDKRCLSLSKEEAEKRVAAGESYVIRQNMPASGETLYTDMVFGGIRVDFKELEDNVLIKSDGMPTYNFANVVDDHLMQINYVMRGIEYLSSTPKYNHIYDCMGWERPKYIHLQPIMRDAAQKLSKRHGAASFEDFIEKGFLSEAIVNYIALLGWNPKDNTEKLSMADMLQRFEISGISRSPSIFDEMKMRYINSLYVKEMSAEAYYKYAVKFFDRLPYLKGYDLEYLASLLQGRTEVFGDIGQLTEFLTLFDGYDLALFRNEKWKTDEALARTMLPDLLSLCDDFENLHQGLEQYAAQKGYKKGQVLWIFRIAITGAANTPGGAGEMARLLGKERVIKRIKESLERLRQ
ncbi:MAG: glutamate--tRNA ligase [Firmicutes bacterium]|nr:glutamate--tRNA ligase [Bacillota bacterium]